MLMPLRGETVMSSLADADAVPPPAGAADGSPGSFPAGYDIDASRNAAESPAAVQKAEAEAPSPAPTADPPELVASMDATRAALSGALPPGVVASLCSARLLARPPYRVVVGVLLALVAERGFGAGLLEAHEAAAPMALDKRGKLFVIARIIAAARHALGGGQLRATPEHVLAGADSIGTNELLQTLAAASMLPADVGAAAVSHVRAAVAAAAAAAAARSTRLALEEDGGPSRVRGDDMPGRALVVSAAEDDDNAICVAVSAEDMVALRRRVLHPSAPPSLDSFYSAVPTQYAGRVRGNRTIAASSASAPALGRGVAGDDGGGKKKRKKRAKQAAVETDAAAGGVEDSGVEPAAERAPFVIAPHLPSVRGAASADRGPGAFKPARRPLARVGVPAGYGPGTVAVPLPESSQAVAAGGHRPLFDSHFLMRFDAKFERLSRDFEKQAAGSVLYA